MSKRDQSVDELAQLIWDYLQLHQPLHKVDIMLVLCSHDLHVADYAVELFMKGYAPLLLFSGGVAHTGAEDLLHTSWEKPEAEMFADVALKRGVPREKILVENRAQNTGENIRFSYDLLLQHKISVSSLMLVQKPYMERRSYATFMAQWPGQTVELSVTSPPISFAQYPNAEISKQDLINIMVGDLQRIRVYGDRGFQIPQEIPKEVWQAYEDLVQLGFTKHLLDQGL